MRGNPHGCLYTLFVFKTRTVFSLNKYDVESVESFFLLCCLPLGRFQSYIFSPSVSQLSLIAFIYRHFTFSKCSSSVNVGLTLSHNYRRVQFVKRPSGPDFLYHRILYLLKAHFQIAKKEENCADYTTIRKSFSIN